jgi:heme/copper-type cytochrome/quinol oxidase subunit 3
MQNYPLSVDRDRALRRQQEMALKNRRTGINVFQISWIMVFICLIVVNWQIRTSAPSWPPAGAQPLEPILPTLATAGLLVSVFFTRRAITALSSDRRQSFFQNWRVTLSLGAVFIGIMLFEWLTIPTGIESAQGSMTIITPETLSWIGQYVTVFRVMTAFHGFHALVIGFYMLWVMRRAEAGAYSSADYWDAEAGAKLWYFVVVAWIMFYVVLYLI